MNRYKIIIIIIMLCFLFHLIFIASAPPEKKGGPSSVPAKSSLVSKTSSTKPQQVPSESGGDPRENLPLSYFRVSSHTDKQHYNRSELIEVSYNVTSCGTIGIELDVPKQFERPIFLNANLRDKSIINNKFYLNLTNKEITIDNFRYRARICNDRKLNGNSTMIDIGSSIKLLSLLPRLEYVPPSPQTITIHNSKPIIFFSKKRSSQLNNTGSELFKDEPVDLIFGARDAEDSKLKYQIYDLDDLLDSGNLDNTHDQEKKTVLFKATKSTDIRINVSDKDNDHKEEIIPIFVRDETVSQYIAVKTIWAVIAVLIISLIGWSIGNYINNSYILVFMLSIFPIQIMLSIVSEDNFGYLRDVANFEVGIYLMTFVFSALFIQSTFKKNRSNLLNYESMRGINVNYDRLMNYIRTQYKSIMTINIKSIKETSSRILSRLQGDTILWIISISSMCVITLIFIKVIPESGVFSSPNDTDRYNYIFWYYSMVPQTFGAILAVVVAFTGWYLAEKNLEPNVRIEFKKRIMRFIFLYMSIIILSVIGLVNATIPPFGNLIYIVSNFPEAISIITLQCTLLLMIPAFAGLFELAKWTMDLNRTGESDPFFWRF